MSMEMSVDEYLFKICRACVSPAFLCFTVAGLHVPIDLQNTLYYFGERASLCGALG